MQLSWNNCVNTDSYSTNGGGGGAESGQLLQVAPVGN